MTFESGIQIQLNEILAVTSLTFTMCFTGHTALPISPSRIANMEIATFVFAPILVASIKIILTKIARGIRSAVPTTKRGRPPPVSSFLGLIPALLTKGPLQEINDCYAKMGSVFTLSLFHLKMTFLVVPEASRHFYQGLNSEISQD